MARIAGTWVLCLVTACADRAGLGGGEGSDGSGTNSGTSGGPATGGTAQSAGAGTDTATAGGTGTTGASSATDDSGTIRHDFGFPGDLGGKDCRTPPCFAVESHAGFGAVVASHDLDADGWPDLVVGTWSPCPLDPGGVYGQLGPTLAAMGDPVPDATAFFGLDLYPSLGAGAFGPVEKADAGGGAELAALALGDFDGDLVPDALAFDTAGVALLLSGIPGGFAPPVPTPLTGVPRALASADLDAVAPTDAVVGRGDAAAVEILTLGSPTGFLVTGAPLGAGDTTPAVLLEDVVGDPARDLVTLVTSNLGARIDVRTGQGDGSFGTTESFDPGPEPTAIALADVDGDGDPDLVIASAVRPGLAVAENPGAFQLAPRVEVASPPLAAVARAQFDGAADDLFLVGQAGAVHVALGGALGPSEAVPHPELPLLQPQFVVVDLDLDGRDDVAAITPTGELVLLRTQP